MKRFYRIVLLFVMALFAVQTMGDSIVLVQKNNQEIIAQEKERFERLIQENPLLLTIQKSSKFTTQIVPSQNRFLLKTGPFDNSNDMALVYLETKAEFPDAFILESDKPAVTKILPSGEKVVIREIPVEKEDRTLWIALFGLAFIGIFALFLSSDQIRNIKKQQAALQEEQGRIETKQNELLANMGEEIYSIAQEAQKTTDEVIEMSQNGTLGDNLEKVKEAEIKLIDVANNLIEYLQLKSKKIDITHEKFNLNNILNEISGSLSREFRGKELAFIFDVDSSVPRFLVGDSQHLEKILANLLENALLATSEGEVHLEISSVLPSKKNGNEPQLKFTISDTGPGLTREELETLFVPKYDEETGQYTGLGLFVAKELIALMGGELTAQSAVGKGSTFDFALQIESDQHGDKRKYRLPSKEMTGKNVFVADTNHNSSLAIQKMFAYFKHDVRVAKPEDFVTQKPDLSGFDIIIINEKLLDARTIEHLTEAKQQNRAQIIGLSSMLSAIDEPPHALVDKQLKTPLQQERTFELITSLYEESHEVLEVPHEETVTIKETPKDTLHVRRRPFVATVGVLRENFVDFSGAHILVVEDNLINQKVLSAMLDGSGITFALAENGKEALRILDNNKHTFDLVLMDINMPVMDGYTATRKIRENSTYDQLPVVALTALVLDSEIDKIYACGVNGFLSKPLNIGKLYSAFDAFIGKAEKSKAAMAAKPAERKTYNGINIEEGIANTNENEVLYKEVLKEFVEAYGESDQLMESLAKEERYGQIQKLCFDIKALAGTIGAHELHSAASNIYKLFLYNTPHLIPLNIVEYSKELATLKNSIQEYIEG